jgi:hypothetical protein
MEEFLIYAYNFVGSCGAIVSISTAVLGLGTQMIRFRHEERVPFSAMMVLTTILAYNVWFLYALLTPTGIQIYLLVADLPGVILSWGGGRYVQTI